MERYSRQILFSPIGKNGQEELRKKHVLIIGAGTLGTQSAEMLVRAGVGQLTIVDRDYVEWSNLQRQQLYTEKDAKLYAPKAIAAKSSLRKINSEVKINAFIMDVTPVELERLIDGVDLILDATDNFDIRMIMNDVSQKYGIPWIYGSCVGSYGMSFTIIPNETPCLHCLLEQVPIGGPTCDTAGIIHSAASQVVVYQTTEALKLLTNNKQSLGNKLISFDVWENRNVQMDVSRLKNDDCLSCGKNASFPFLSYEHQMKTAVLCGREAVQIKPAEVQHRNFSTMAKRLEQLGGAVKYNDFLLSFSFDQERMVIFRDGRALIHGTNDIEQAKTLYYRYFG